MSRYTEDCLKADVCDMAVCDGKYCNHYVSKFEWAIRSAERTCSACRESLSVAQGDETVHTLQQLLCAVEYIILALSAVKH